MLVPIDPSKIKTAAQIESERLASKAAQVRAERDTKMQEVVNWYQRYDREARQQLQHVLTLDQIDQYATALAELPEQLGFPENVEWPISPI